MLYCVFSQIKTKKMRLKVIVEGLNTPRAKNTCGLLIEND